MAKQYDWKQIKVEYIEGNALNAISRKHGCNRASIRKHASAEGWQRPDPSDKYKTDILSKATHSELIKFNPVYKKCHHNMAEGQKYYRQAHPTIKKLKHRIQILNMQVRELKKNHQTENNSFFSWVKIIMMALKKINLAHS